MKRQFVCLFFIPLLLLFSISAQKAASAAEAERSEQVEVVSILGYVEVRKQGQNDWEVAKKGMELSTEDLVRIPPKATLRIRLENGDAVYFVPGQERLVKNLAPTEKRRIVDGRTRSSKAVNMSRQQIRQTRQSDSPSLMTDEHVDFLLSMLFEDANNKSVRSFAQSTVEDIPIKLYFCRFLKNPVLARVLTIGQMDHCAPANPHEIWILYPAPQKVRNYKSR